MASDPPILPEALSLSAYVLWIYGLLFLFALAFIPLAEGLGGGAVFFILAFWLPDSTIGSWVLWGLAVVPLGLVLALPHPRWKWWRQGSPSLISHALAVPIVVWPMMLAAYAIWNALMPLPDYGG